MDRSVLLSHLRKTHFAPGNRKNALADAKAIAHFLNREYQARVIGIGSLFESDRAFYRSSDIDLVVEGIPDDRFFEATARAAAMTDLKLDVIPLEDADDYIREVVTRSGVKL